MQIGTMRFDRMEVAGSLGDLGTLLPLAAGMIMVNGLSGQGVFLAVGLFYILAGWYYRVPIAVQPMKVVGAYAVATGAAAVDIQAAGLLVGLFLLVIGFSNLIQPIARFLPKSVIRGVQLSTGALLAAKGVSFIAGTSDFQKTQGAAEPFLTLQSLGPVPMSLIAGLIFGVLTFLLLENRKAPAGLAVVLGGALFGLLCGGAQGADFAPGLHFPELFPFGLPGWASMGVVLFTMVLPQLPMTIGNAVIANADLSADYFQEESRRVTPKSLCLSMGLANIGSLLLGGMPMCHGAGGLAAHYRFGARTSGSNMIIGGAFVFLALLLGDGVLGAVRLLPLGVLGVLLVFAGVQLSLTILDMQTRKDMFVPLLMLAVTLASNLAVAFGLGAAVSLALRSRRFSV